MLKYLYQKLKKGKVMEKIYNFSLENKDDVTYELIKALRVCKKENYTKIVFEKGNYNVYREFSEQRNLSISNHGINGPKRIAVLLEDIENFCLDFNGSTLIAHGNMIPIAIRNSKNVAIKNVILENPQTQFMQGRVTKAENGVVEFKIENGVEQFFTENGMLFSKVGDDFLVPQSTSIEFNGKTGELEYGTGDFPIGFPWEVENELKGDVFTVRNAKRMPPIGNVFVHTAARRLGCGIFCEGSSDLLFENVTVRSCLGMGLLAQFCHNVTLDKYSTLRKEGMYYTADADATHFVHCTGLVKVENGVFEGQLDDALNIHGVFVRVIGKEGKNALLIKQMHYQATGLPILEKGDKVDALKVDTLIPYTQITVKEVDCINDEVSKVTFFEDVESIAIGDDLENVTKSADLIFRNNVVRDNRARGMLIASKGKTIIENNYFHTSGCAILFESDGQYWFESGGTTDVVIKNNVFDRCKHGTWGLAVIEFAKREKTEENKYYHQKISVIDNKFTMYNDLAITFDNILDLTFANNSVEGKAEVEVTHCGKQDLQKEGFIYK